jgi:hypothetical protein
VGIDQFRFSAKGVSSIEAAFSCLDKYRLAPGWTVQEFASNLAAWFIDEGLMPVHVAPNDFERFILWRAGESGSR